MKLSLRGLLTSAPSILTAAEVNAALDRTLGQALIAAGFVAVGPRSWVRQGTGPVRHLVEVGALKGATYAPKWGISLDYVPHVAGRGRVRWHRTVKSARFDLTFDPFDYEDPSPWCVDLFMSERELQVRCASLAPKVVRAVSEFTAPLTSDAAILEAFEAKRRRPTHRFAFESYYQNVLAYAFTLARVGQPNAAEEWLDQCVRGTWPDDEGVALELARALRAEMQNGRGE